MVVDETADLDNAATCIIEGASFDNNLLCIGEKEVFVVASVADAFIAAMRRAGAFQLDTAAIERLTKAAFTFEAERQGLRPRARAGRSWSARTRACWPRPPASASRPAPSCCSARRRRIIAFVEEEQMMPFLPVVRVNCVDGAISAALEGRARLPAHGHHPLEERGNVTKMARSMNTTLFVQNAPSTAALGVDGPGYLSYSIATPTGEGVTTPLTFTRERQITIGGALRIV